MRPGESQGNPYHFVSQGTFQQGIDEGKFIEHAQQYNDNYYGVASEELERIGRSDKIGIWKLDYKGVMTAKEKYPDIVSILVNAPSLEILENRIRQRDNGTDAYVRERMEYTKEWLKHTDMYDHVVVNEEGQLEKAVEETAQIIKKYNG
jgi:guanylate kinase